jgi:diketogulonate reductase-like aldo/keto reductase
MEELGSIENGTNCAANQVLYSLENREIESGLLQWSGKNDVPIMAYSPVGHGRGLLENATLRKIADRHDATPSEIALAWVLREPDVIAIPKASDQSHVRENAHAIEIRLTKPDLKELDDEFPSPDSKQPLPML